MQFVIGLLLLGAVGNSIDQDLEFVRALRKESHFRLTQRQCQELLAAEGISDHQRTQVVVEISKTFASQALNSRTPRREEFWQQAIRVLENESGQQSDPVLRLLLQTQVAFVAQQQAEWAVREAEVRSQSASDWSTARIQLREAIQKLKELQAAFVTPALRRQTGAMESRLQELQRNVQFQLARGYLHQGIAYGDNQRDRTNALTQALALFETIANGREQDDLVWRGKIDRIRCLRMLGQLDAARKLLGQLSAAPQQYIGALAAESVRLALDADNLEVAMQLVLNEQIEGQDPEFQLARIEALVTAAERLQGQSKALGFQQKATAAVAEMLGNYGVYWSLRGEILLTRLARQGGNANASLLNNAAETMLKRDSPDEAKRMFVRAAEQEDDVDKAFDFLFKAAIVDHREGKLQLALERFRSVALKYPTHGKAAESHLLAVFDAAAVYQKDAIKNESVAQQALSQYEALLQEHLQQWPASATADQARIWAAKLATAKRDWMAAIQLYQGVTIGSPLELQAYEDLSEAYLRWLAEMSPILSDAELSALVDDQLQWMVARVDQLPAGKAKSKLAKEAARLAMNSAAQDFQLATRLLRKVNTGGGGVDFDLETLVIVAQAGSGLIGQSQARLAKASPFPRESLVAILRGLQVVRDLRQTRNASLAALTREVTGLLQPYADQLTAEDQLVWQRAIADDLDPEEAVQRYRDFAKAFPSNTAVQRRFAELLAGIPTQESREMSLIQWRKIVKQNKPRSTTWFRAKLGVARAHFELGQRKQAKELIEYLQTLYPQMGGPALREQFDQLLKVCRT